MVNGVVVVVKDRAIAVKDRVVVIEEEVVVVVFREFIVHG